MIYFCYGTLYTSLQSMAGARVSFLKKYVSSKGLKTALHARDLVKFWRVFNIVQKFGSFEYKWG